MPTSHRDCYGKGAPHASIQFANEWLLLAGFFLTVINLLAYLQKVRNTIVWLMGCLVISFIETLSKWRYIHLLVQPHWESLFLFSALGSSVLNTAVERVYYEGNLTHHCGSNLGSESKSSDSLKDTLTFYMREWI